MPTHHNRILRSISMSLMAKRNEFIPINLVLRIGSKATINPGRGGSIIGRSRPGSRDICPTPRETIARSNQHQRYWLAIRPKPTRGGAEVNILLHVQSTKRGPPRGEMEWPIQGRKLEEAASGRSPNVAASWCSQKQRGPLQKDLGAKITVGNTQQHARSPVGVREMNK